MKYYCKAFISQFLVYNKCSVKVRDDDEEEGDDLSRSASIGQSFIPNQQRAADFFVQRWQMSGVGFIQHTLRCLGTLIHKDYLGAVFLNRDRLIELCISLSWTLIILVPAIIF